jgi:tetratricopeptide (TPR) repeat protein
MAYQRSENTRAAVREYLAIARALQERGETQKALQMCQAALRLDPTNEDALTAIQLVRHGAEAFAEPEEAPPPPAPAETAATGDLADTVRQLASMFEAGRVAETPGRGKQEAADPVTSARSRAQDELAAEIFREEDTFAPAPLSKLERDALVGQAIDFEMRGQTEDAVSCYEKAIQGGLKLAAAFFALGVLYTQLGKTEAARQALRLAGREAAYQRAAAILLSRLG